MDINTLKTFITVCEYGSFTAAAEKLGYTQPTVSAQIKQLENELNTTLFDRIRHNTTITSKGTTILSQAREILQIYAKMQETANLPQEITGEIRLAMADSVCSRFFTDDYLNFHAQYPNIKIKITSAGSEEMFDMLNKNEADIVFTLDSRILDSQYIICAESVEHVHFVASAEHELTRRKQLDIKDMISERFYLTEPGMSYRRIMDFMLAEKSLSLSPVMEMGSPEQICKLLVKGNAISLLPDYVTEQYIKSDQIKYLPIDNFNIEVWNQIFIHRDKWISPAMKVFIDFYKKVISSI